MLSVAIFVFLGLLFAGFASFLFLAVAILWWKGRLAIPFFGGADRHLARAAAAIQADAAKSHAERVKAELKAKLVELFDPSSAPAPVASVVTPPAAPPTV